jgi:hypothetical protein
MNLRQDSLDMELASMIQTMIDKEFVSRADLDKGYSDIKEQMTEAAKRARALEEEKLKQQVENEAGGVQLSLPSLT